MSLRSFIPEAILFDLDGTLADTAPDLGAAVNKMRVDRRLAPMPQSALRPFASGGARALLAAGFDVTPEHAEFESMRQEFLTYYEAAICCQSALFSGIAHLLEKIMQTDKRWGIVTNKAEKFTHALLPQLGLLQADCVVCGDTTSHLKPHPASLLEAARRLNIAPAHCCYVGDDLRDITAAHAAGMYSIAAGWGYGRKSEIASWQAHLVMDTPQDLFIWLNA